MPLAFMLLVAGCARGLPPSPPPARRRRPRQPSAPAPALRRDPRPQPATRRDLADRRRDRPARGARRRRPGRRRRAARPRLRAPPTGPRDRRSVPLRAGGRRLRDGPEAGTRRRPGPGRDRRAAARQSTSSPRRSTPAAQAVALSPNLAAARAVVVDALVELGRYDEADAAAGEMLAIRADLSTLARVSYVAELHGKLDVALSAMRQAAATPGLAPENVAFVDALLGNLLVYTGDPDGRRGRVRAGPRARARRTPRRSPGRAGWRSGPATSTGRSPCSSGPRTSCRCPNTSSPWPRPRPRPAEPTTRRATSSSPAPRSSSSRPAGVIVDLELALFEADHGDPAAALELAEAGYAATPTVRAADALGLGAPPPRPRRGGEDVARTRRSGWARATRSCATTPARSPRRSATSRARAATSSWRSRRTRASRRPGPRRPVGSSTRCPTDPARSVDSSNRRGRCASATTAPDGGRDPFSCTRPRRASGRSEDPPPRHQGRQSCPHDQGSPASPAPCSSRRHPSRVSSRPATGRRRSSRAIPPRTTRTCTRSSVRTIRTA